MAFVSRVAVVVALLALAGCARPPSEGGPSSRSLAHGYADNPDLVTTGALPVEPFRQVEAPVLHANGQLAGRTLAVASVGDIALKPGEVILTFDDGPRPGRTERILDALDKYGVKATFLMLGQMAHQNPKTAQAVALRGHTIGTHTYDHANLTALGAEAAAADIKAGQSAVASALAAINRVPSPFFRFPYLAQSAFLNVSLAGQETVVLGVDIDSKDYYSSTPEEVLARTLARLDARGSGIVLFHDIHARTVAMMPQFLQALQDRGYKVVRLTAKGRTPFDTELVTAGEIEGSAS